MWKLGIVMMLLLTGCSSLLYYPTQIEYAQSSQLPWPVTEGFLKDELGHSIHYWHFKSKAPKAKIAFFHGNAQNLSAHFAMLAWLVDYNYDFLIFDYPGYGKSSGQPTPETTVKSGVAALKYLSEQGPDIPMIVYGQSLGGQIAQKAMNLFDRSKVSAVFLESSFLSYRSVARDVLKKNAITWLFQPVGWLVMSDRWAGDPEQISPTPLFVLHGVNDSVVRINQGRMIFEAAKDPKEWIEFKEGDHNNIYFVKQGQNRRVLLDLLEKTL